MPLADGIGATGGTDINGATALGNQSAICPHTRVYAGHADGDLKLDPHKAAARRAPGFQTT
ncbi:MAG: hypothetical protein ACLTLQ_09770 [[Clostridium] scindens]